MDLLLVLVTVLAVFVYFYMQMTTDKREYTTILRLEGDPKIVCPHCHSAGGVTTKKVAEKTGVDGGKATAAILTDGISLLATGLSGQRERTEATCSSCHCVWRF